VWAWRRDDLASSGGLRVRCTLPVEPRGGGEHVDVPARAETKGGCEVDCMAERVAEFRDWSEREAMRDERSGEEKTACMKWDGRERHEEGLSHILILIRVPISQSKTFFFSYIYPFLSPSPSSRFTCIHTELQLCVLSARFEVSIDTFALFDILRKEMAGMNRDMDTVTVSEPKMFVVGYFKRQAIIDYRNLFLPA
jgi:hypothetical protein